MISRWLLSSLAAFALCSCDQTIVSSASPGGTNDETSSFYLPNGRKAAHAAVTVFDASRTDSLPVAKVYTDDEGRASLEGISRGYYNLIVRDDAGRAAFVAAVFSDGTSARYLGDTLRNTGKIKGRVRLQIQDSPRLAWVALPGTGTIVNVDDSGRFVLQEIPEGKYSLLARTDGKEYTSTFRSVVVHRDSTTDVGDIPLVYTGLPAVTGLTGVWDSLGGNVVLNWTPATSPDVQGYYVYRQYPGNPIGPSRIGRLGLESTSWSENIFHTWDFPGSATIQYWVVAFGKDESVGPRWESWTKTMVTPPEVDQLPVDWDSSGASPIPCKEYCTLDTLQGELLMVATDNNNRYHASVSSNGSSWTELIDFSKVVDPPAKFTGISLASTIGLHGVTFQGRFWWVKSQSAHRFTPLPWDSLALYDSLQILSMDGSGWIDSATVPAFDDSISSARLVVDSTGLVLLQGSRWNPYDDLGMQVRSRKLRSSTGSWVEGPWARWIVERDFTTFGFASTPRQQFVSPSGNPFVPQVPRYEFSFWQGVYLDSIFVYSGQPLLLYTRTPANESQHLVRGSIPARALTWWRGYLWAAGANRVWKGKVR